MKSDPNVYLFYKSEGIRRWVCAVARRLNGDGFLVTTYPTDAIKEGEHLWPKQKPGRLGWNAMNPNNTHKTLCQCV